MLSLPPFSLSLSLQGAWARSGLRCRPLPEEDATTRQLPALEKNKKEVSACAD
uniref:Uncharacterized protein n=1 Tax=Arundo donax TaxID=35708 RepID=A0A0A8YXF9_ARUDO